MSDRAKEIKNQLLNIDKKLATFIFAITLVILLFTMSIIRGQCISTGYELSKLTDDVEKRRIKIESLEALQARVLNKEALFNAATERGFILMNEGRTFNVQ